MINGYAEDWASVIGLVLTAIGVILAIVPPMVGADWADETSAKYERRQRIRYFGGIALILIGTALQIYASWPV